LSVFVAPGSNAFNEDGGNICSQVWHIGTKNPATGH
jgi:hypothetical protein